ncbi:MAG: trypsin-like peptidase domain-containing protein [Firmicutes bacterium]|nr:trypsin-like peptidase domain-containing protein [Bacillota bacterium]
MRFFTFRLPSTRRRHDGLGYGESSAWLQMLGAALLFLALFSLWQGNGSPAQEKYVRAIVGVAEQVSPTVVYIENIAGHAAGGSGSGVIVSPKGYIITNNHVVAGCDALEVYLADGRRAKGRLVGADSSVDLALVKIDLPDLPAARLGDSAALSVGQLVFAIGNPGGARFSRSMTMGLVSGLNRVLQLPDGDMADLIQTDAAINPGNSGGPLVNLEGEVVGITSIKIVDTCFEGMGFAVPINTAVAVIDRLSIPVTTNIW